MGVVILSETAYGKELAKFEQTGRPGEGKSRRYEPFPKQMYKAGRNEHGVVERIIAFDRVVQNEAEMARLETDGYRKTIDEAIAEFNRWDDLIAEEAARRAFSDRKMSAKAQAEAARVEEASGIDMVPSVPETPIRKRVGWPKGKPRKAAPVPQTEN